MRVNGTDMTITRGDTAVFTLKIEDIENQGINFQAGDRVYFTVKTSTQTESIAFQKVIDVYQDDDSVRLEIFPEDTKELRVKDYVYDIQYNKVNGEVHTIVLPSKFILGPEVTYD